jgi:hypothetical protein
MLKASVIHQGTKLVIPAAVRRGNGDGIGVKAGKDGVFIVIALFSKR